MMLICLGCPSACPRICLSVCLFVLSVSLSAYVSCVSCLSVCACYSRVLSSRQTIEFPDDELVEPLEGLDLAEDGIDLPPPPAPEPEPELEMDAVKPNLLVRGENPPPNIYV